MGTGSGGGMDTAAVAPVARRDAMCRVSQAAAAAATAAASTATATATATADEDAVQGRWTGARAAGGSARCSLLSHSLLATALALAPGPAAGRTQLTPHPDLRFKVS